MRRAAAMMREDHLYLIVAVTLCVATFLILAAILSF
jgi:hypothetical protein